MSDDAGPSMLPSGWSEHVSPAGRAYYHHSASGVSTYDRPTPSSLRGPKQKREKPTSKTPIPGADGWFRVTTNCDHVFYFHPQSRTSEWIAPADIAARVREMEQEAQRAAHQERRLAQQEEQKKRDDEKRSKRERKRKAEQGVPITEFDATAEAKRARPDDEEDADDTDGSDSTDNTEGAREAHDKVADPAPPFVPEEMMVDQVKADEEDDDDDEWQRQMAEQMAAEAETEAPASATPEPASAPEAEAAGGSIEEHKAAFMALLSSLTGTRDEINPMAPWDLEQRKFSQHAAFQALPVREREDAFNEWCKLRLREKRAAKAAATPSASSSSGPAASVAAASSAGGRGAESEFRALLRREVRSTRTAFGDFKAAFGRDGRFSGFGRSDAERERVFRAHLVELGEAKRAAAERAEAAFLALLGETVPGSFRGRVAEAQRAAHGREERKARTMEVWMHAKRTPGVLEDARYDAVGSSTRRFELFVQWAQGERRPDAREPASAPAPAARKDQADGGGRMGKEEARAKAMRDREATVRRERERLSRLNRHALATTTRQDSRLGFGQLLVDAVSSPHVDYRCVRSQLAADERFHGQLSEDDKEAMFDAHVARLRGAEREKLARVFARHAPRLDANAEDVVALTLHDDALQLAPLGFYRSHPDELQRAYEAWDEQRQRSARSEFDQMLTESAFVDFWGRMKKSAVPTSASQQARGVGEEADEESVMLVDLARSVDARQIQAVLSGDQRFRAFSHVADQREQWIRDHLERLAAPRQSVHR